ncbi:Uncharacterised protein r2_g2651 [Pycnogonum litorale]
MEATRNVAILMLFFLTIFKVMTVHCSSENTEVHSENQGRQITENEALAGRIFTGTALAIFLFYFTWGTLSPKPTSRSLKTNGNYYATKIWKILEEEVFQRSLEKPPAI